MAQTLETMIVINAKTGPGFSQVGNTLTQLGALVNGMSQELISFGEDSVQVYKEYEKSMKDAEVALSTTYGRGTAQLNKVMGELDASATEWAASTIFHTNDVANAISEAAHAGWDYEQIMNGIPAAMKLAQAGNMDLSESVNYIVKSTNAAGVGFEDLTGFIDLWTFAANSSASDIREFGDAMLRMGSTMRFTGSSEELMTLIAMTANAGATGSEAGTLIRNSMMRLIAPTKKASDVMSELGVSSEEASELINDVALAQANATLEAKGFSVYDEKGNLRNMLDIYSDLYQVLGDVAGGYENIEKNEDALNILSAIFPVRSITEALTLMKAAKDNYDGLYDSMMNGDAAGYGQYAADTMMDTLYGSIETFGSKLERLKQITGEHLSGQVRGFLDTAGGFIDNIANMDEGKFSALVSGLEVIAAAGPTLLATGTAFRMLGLMLTPAGMLGTGIITLASLAAYMNELQKVDFSNAFGLGGLDRAEISQHIKDLSADFDQAYSSINQFRSAVDKSVESYTNASQEFSSELLTQMITGATLTDPDIQNLTNLGKTMTDSVFEGMKQSKNASMSYFELLFGGDTDNADYQNLTEMTSEAYQEGIEQAGEIGRQMREAMTSAFADGSVSQEEYENIMSYVKSLNEAMAQAAAEAQAEQDYVDQQMMLHKAQTASLDEIKAISMEISDERERVLGEASDAYYRERYKAEYGYNKAISEGKATKEEMYSALGAIDQKYNDQVTQQNAVYDRMSVALMDSQIKQSGLSDLYNNLMSYSNMVLGGDLTYDEAHALSVTLGKGKQNKQLQDLLAYQIDSLGGYDTLENSIKAYAQSGNTEMAKQLAQIYSAQQILSGGDRTAINEGLFGGTKVDVLEGTQLPSFQAMLSENAELFQQGYKMELSVVPVVEDLDEIHMDPVPLPIEPKLDPNIDSAAALEEQGVTVDVEGDTQSLQATIEAEDGKELLTYVNGDAENLEMSITDQDGRVLVETVTGNASSLSSIIESFNGRTITVNIAGKKLFAEGGRATEASIFGEAGPEWAIPEAHTQRTAEPLNMAREASGFSWGELLSLNGGLNAGSSRIPTTIVYSPTVNAVNAAGVDEVLRADKERLDKWFSEKIMRDAMEVYS